ncbi:MAG: DUF1365 family protein [bacterium]|nr:DUF1365 family protein [bacterium]
MKTQIFTGKVMHERLKPRIFRFTYPIVNLFLNLDEIKEIFSQKLLFALNRFSLLSFYDRDYVEPTEEPWRSKINKLLGQESSNVKSINILTSPRLLGYTFNPVSFYFCLSEDKRVVAIFVEINNTFGERHIYKLHLNTTSLIEGISAKHPKEFYVSPFNEVQGDYEYLFKLNQNILQIDLNIREGSELVFRSRVEGKLTNFTKNQLIIKILKNPFLFWSAMPRILWQAAKLFYNQGYPVREKPIPSHKDTYVTATPTFFERWAMSLAFNFLSHIRIGKLIIELPNGETKIFGDSCDTQSATMKIHEYKFFKKVILHGDIGFGEAFTEGLWATPDLTAVISLFIKNEKALSEQPSLFSKIGVIRNRLLHIRRKNTKKGSLRNIKEHYDLSNNLFKLFLDESMMYSCGIFANPDDSLNAAQNNKINTIIEKTQINSSDHVLEIGSGWGGFAITAVQKTGCKVTTITLSAEQKVLAEERIRAANLSDRIDVQLLDYRNIVGKYDKIVSIEMIEAVGQRFLREYFSAISNALRPGGKALIQAITIPDQRYDLYSKSVDWIQKHIFPGSHIPSLGAINTAISEKSNLLTKELESIGLHYSQTLRQWRTRFNAASSELTRNGFGMEFQRAWNYYFCYCEAGFSTKALDVLHIMLQKPDRG